MLPSINTILAAKSEPSSTCQSPPSRTTGERPTQNLAAILHCTQQGLRGQEHQQISMKALRHSRVRFWPSIWHKTLVEGGVLVQGKGSTTKKRNRAGSRPVRSSTVAKQQADGNLKLILQQKSLFPYKINTTRSSPYIA